LLSSSLTDVDLVENMVAIFIPAPSVIHTLVEIPEEFIFLSLRSTPSPYVQAVEDDPLHDGVPEYLVDQDQITLFLCCS
jgi:hypothetical protein